MVPGDASSQEPEQNYCVGSGSYLLTRKVFLLHQFSLKLLRCGWAHFSFQFWPFHKVLVDNDVSNLKYLTIYSRSQIRLWNIKKNLEPNKKDSAPQQCWYWYPDYNFWLRKNWFVSMILEGIHVANPTDDLILITFIITTFNTASWIFNTLY